MNPRMGSYPLQSGALSVHLAKRPMNAPAPRWIHSSSVAVAGRRRVSAHRSHFSANLTGSLDKSIRALSCSLPPSMKTASTPFGVGRNSSFFTPASKRSVESIHTGRTRIRLACPMSRQAVIRPSLNDPFRRASACGAISSAADRAASRAAASRASASGSLSLRDSSALRLLSRLSRKLILLLGYRYPIDHPRCPRNTGSGSDAVAAFATRGLGHQTRTPRIRYDSEGWKFGPQPLLP